MPQWCVKQIIYKFCLSLILVSFRATRSTLHSVPQRQKFDFILLTSTIILAFRSDEANVTLYLTSREQMS